jgi:glycosyltransferase involved in cell wall biosynthesis
LPELAALGARNQVRVIPNGTDFAPAPERRDLARASLGLADSDVAFLLVGRLERQKRIDRFIEAIAIAQRSSPEVVGLIAGAGPDSESLSRLVTETGARVRFLGRRDDMPDVLAAADALCLVSDHEALPFVVLEAMATGRPVLATRVGGLPEVVADGETGLLFSPGDQDRLVSSLLELTSDPRRRASMGLAGRAHQISRYSAERMTDDYAALLSGL